MKKTLSYIGLILILILGLTSCVKKEDENYANQTKANTVITEINQLPTTDAIELTDEVKVANVRSLYNALSKEAKALVTNLDKLEALENKLIELKKAKDNQDKANVVIELINKLPAADELTLEGEDKVKEARTSYEALSEEVKALVTNLGKLEALEDKMKELIEDKKLHDEATMVVVAIDNLPNVELITLDAESAIVNARNAYNSLAPKAKALVTNLN